MKRLLTSAIAASMLLCLTQEVWSQTFPEGPPQYQRVTKTNQFGNRYTELVPIQPSNNVQVVPVYPYVPQRRAYSRPYGAGSYPTPYYYGPAVGPGIGGPVIGGPGLGGHVAPVNNWLGQWTVTTAGRQFPMTLNGQTYVSSTQSGSWQLSGVRGNQFQMTFLMGGAAKLMTGAWQVPGRQFQLVDSRTGEQFFFQR